MRQLVCLSLLALACDRRPIASEASVVAITLDGAWSNKTWISEPYGAARNTPVRLSTTVTVPEAFADTPSTLVLEGLWWSTRIWVDDIEVGTVVGGRPPAKLALPEGLSAGEHVLSLVVSGPYGVSSFAHGGGLGSGASTVRPTLHRPPVLEVGTQVPMETAGIRLQPDGAVAFVQFDSRAVPEGASARIFTALDGRIHTDFGVHPVEADGSIRTPPQQVEQPLWSWGDPALTHMMVELRDATGAPIATYSTRTGLRSTQLSASGLQINDEVGTAVAIRVPWGLGEPDLLTVFAGAAGAGVNAVELHGSMVHSQQLDIADELGIPIVQLPRCVGRVKRPPGTGAGLLETLREQDIKLVRGVGAHPSVVSWLLEGDRHDLGPGRRESDEQPPWTSVITSDPMHRPVAGANIPGTLLRITDLRSSTVDCPSGCAGKWIVEATFRIGPVPDLWSNVASAWSKVFATGIPGGTLPSPNAAELGRWTAAFGPVLKKAGVRPFPLDRSRRASSRVQVEGAVPGTLVWAEAPGMTLRGAQVGSEGTAQFDVWYEGPATVRGEGWSRDVTLTPMTWEGVRMYGYPTTVKAPAVQTPSKSAASPAG